MVMILYLVWTNVQAQDQSKDELLELSLEELLDLQVTSASKREERIQDAPSVITTISAREIEDFGGNSLLDILSRAASFYDLSSYVFRKNSMGLRGDLTTHVNPRILYLINGRPFRESVIGGQNMNILTAFPIYSIKQIEIIRGPGSVLYGSNAYVGVVNIITKDGEEPSLDVRAGTGTYNARNVQVNGARRFGDLGVSAGVQYMNNDGWRFADSTRFLGPNRSFGENELGENILSSNLQLHYKGFSLSSFYGSNDLDGIAAVTSEPVVYESRRIFTDLGYQRFLIPDTYEIQANITYNRLKDHYQVGLTDAFQRFPKTDDYVFEVTNFFTLSEQFELTVGGSYQRLKGEQRNGNDVLSVPAYNLNWSNVYLQADYHVNNQLKFVAGGQLNKVEGIDANFVPRIAAIGTFPSGFGVKVMYGEAFRAPYAVEKGIFSPAVAGNPDLVPENIATFETQVSYVKNQGSTVLTFFRSKQSEIIGRIPNPTAETALLYENLGERTSSGLELESTWSLSANTYLTGSYSLQTNEADDGTKDVSRLPRHMLKVGVSHQLTSYLKLAVFNSHYSAPFDQENSESGRGDLKAFSWLTARLDFSVAQLTGGEKRYGITFEGVNLLDEEVYNPEINFRNYNAVRSQPGRMILASAYLKF